MATLQKFELLATQCTVVGSPNRSPTTSPIIHLRRKKTLRMLLGRAGCGGGRSLPECPDEGSPDRRDGHRHGSDEGSSPEEEAESSVRHKLKDLFVSSPPAFGERVSYNVRERLLTTGSGSGGGVRGSMYRSLRQRLTRRAWRPALVAIPE